MQNDKKNASAYLTVLADRAAQALQPEARGAATAATLRELAAIPGLPDIHPSSLVEALIILSQRQSGDLPPVAARRLTCRELSDITPGGTLSIASVSSEALLLWSAFTRLAGEGPRYDAIRATAQREFAELLAAADDAAKLAFAFCSRAA
jgi:hypothetical protein